jgi:hypothetical protein
MDSEGMFLSKRDPDTKCLVRAGPDPDAHLYRGIIHVVSAVLGTEPDFRTLNDAVLNDYDVIIACGSDSLREDEYQAIAEFTRKGGSLLITCGMDLSSDAMNSLNILMEPLGISVCLALCLSLLRS